MVTFSIAGIIQSIDKQLYCYDTSYCTYQEALIHSECDFDMTVAIYATLASGYKRYLFIDMNALLSDYLTGKGEKLIYNVSVWQDLADFLSNLYNTDITVFNKYLTYTGVPRYQHYRDKYDNVHTRNTPFYTNMTESIDIISLGYTTDIKGSYVNKDAPKIRDLPGRRVSLPDLVFSKTNDDVTFDLKNTLVSVDGVVCYPIYSESTDELYACNGARFLKNTTDSTSLNIILMNFANLGTLHHYKLSDCKQELVVKSGDRVYLYDNANKVADNLLDSSVEYWHQAQYSMRFTMPEGAVNGHPLLCLAGRLFFPGLDDLVTYTNTEGRIVVEFHIANDVLENIVASNLQHQNMFYSKSAMFRVILSYVFCNIFIDQAYQYDEGTDEWLALQFHMDQIIPFITMIETDKQYTIDRLSGTPTFQYGKIIFPPYSKGLLMNRDTRELIDYTRIPYKDQTLVTFSPQNSLFIEKREGANTNNDLRTSTAITYDEAIEFAPETTEIVYNTREHRFKLMTYTVTNEESGKTTHVSIIAQSEGVPYETSDSGTVPYTWAQVVEYIGKSEEEIVPVKDNTNESWCVFDDNDLPIFETLKNTVGKPYTELTWYKVKAYNANDIKWYQLWDGANIVTDGVRTDRMAWQLDPTLFIDQYNKFEIGEYIKDPKHYELIDICIEGSTGDTSLLPDEDNPETQPDPEDDLSNPMNPVYTVEYEKVKDDIKIGDYISIVTTGTTSVSTSRDVDLNGEFISVRDGTYSFGATWTLSKTYADKTTQLMRNALFTISFKQIKADYELTSDTTFSSTKVYYAKIVETGKDDRYVQAVVEPGETIPANTYYECYTGIGYWIIEETDDTTLQSTIVANSNNGVAPSTRNTDDPGAAVGWVLTTAGKALFGGTLEVRTRNPKVISQFKVDITIKDGEFSTNMIVGKNAANISEVYAKYDGNYRLTVEGATGIDRIWEHQKYSNVVIKYIPATSTAVAHWAVVDNGVEMLVTDYADTGTAPYTSILTWS